MSDHSTGTQRTRPPITFAHRGARAHARENTMEAFKLAVELGASGLETDAWVTVDGVAVLDHDGVVSTRFGRKRPISTLTRRALPQHIPTAAEFFDVFADRFDVSIDVKSSATTEPLLAAAREAAPAALERLWLCLPRFEELLGLRDRGVKLVHSARLSRLPHSLERHAALLQHEGIDVLNLHHSEWNAGRVSLLHRFGRLAFGWDLQEPRLLAKALDQGLDGIYSDWVDRMIAATRAAAGD